MSLFDIRKNTSENAPDDPVSPGSASDVGVIGGEYRTKNGETRQIYSDAHFVPLGESADPPKYYTPVQRKESAAVRTGLNRTVVTAVLCAVFAILGCVTGAGIVSRRTASRIGDLQAKVEALSEDLAQTSAGVSKVPAVKAAPEVIYVDPVSAEANFKLSENPFFTFKIYVFL